MPLKDRLRAEGLRGMLTQTSGDLFHPNDRGYETWADTFWAEISRSSLSTGSRGVLECPLVLRFIDEGGNNFWGVEVFERDGVEYVALSDRDKGLYVLRHTP